VSEHVNEDGLGEFAELGDGFAALGTQ